MRPDANLVSNAFRSAWIVVLFVVVFFVADAVVEAISVFIAIHGDAWPPELWILGASVVGAVVGVNAAKVVVEKAHASKHQHRILTFAFVGICGLVVISDIIVIPQEYRTIWFWQQVVRYGAAGILCAAAFRRDL